MFRRSKVYRIGIPTLHHKEAPEVEQDEEVTDDERDEGQDKEQDKTTKTLTLTQEQLNEIVESRLARERKKAQEDQEKAEAKARADALKAQEKYQELAESETKRADEAEAKLAQLATEKEELEAKVQRYEDALNHYVEERKKDLPKAILELLADRDPVAQLEWLVKNAGNLKSGKEGVPKTPKGNRSGESEEQRRSAREAFARRYRSF